jgi:hypothetical protein
MTTYTREDLEAMIETTSDALGECDRCHSHQSLWGDPNTEHEGEFALCRDCWRFRLDKMKEAEG